LSWEIAAVPHLEEYRQPQKLVVQEYMQVVGSLSADAYHMLAPPRWIGSYERDEICIGRSGHETKDIGTLMMELQLLLEI
jgi:hypothetical protein